jgi:hypothetical protein
MSACFAREDDTSPQPQRQQDYRQDLPGSDCVVPAVMAALVFAQKRALGGIGSAHVQVR